MESTTLYFKSMALNQSVVFISKKIYKLAHQRKFLSLSKTSDSCSQVHFLSLFFLWKELDQKIRGKDSGTSEILSFNGKIMVTILYSVFHTRMKHPSKW